VKSGTISATENSRAPSSDLRTKNPACTSHTGQGFLPGGMPRAACCLAVLPRSRPTSLAPSRLAGTGTQRRLSCRSPRADIAHLSVSNIHDGNCTLQELQEVSGGNRCAFRRKLWKRVEIQDARRDFAIVVGQLALAGAFPTEEEDKGEYSWRERISGRDSWPV
jgi:hypothetical protein